MANPYGSLATGPAANALLLPIDDIFTIKHRGIVVTGRIVRGAVQVGEAVEVVGRREPSRQVIVKELEMMRQVLQQAQAGDVVGCLLHGVQHPTDLERGQVLARPGSIRAYRQFSAQVQMLTREQGGRHTPFFEDYRPNVHIHSADVPGVVKLPLGMPMGIPGESFEVAIELAAPVALEVGMEFHLREAGHVVGRGTCTRIDAAYPY